MVVKQSAYDSFVGKPPRQSKKKLLGGLKGRFKRGSGVLRGSSTNADDASFDGSLSNNGAGATNLAVHGPPPSDEQRDQPLQESAQVLSQGTFIDARKDEGALRAAASSLRSDAQGAVARTTSPKNLAKSSPSKSTAKNVKPKQTLVITSRKALYDPEVRAEVTRLYNLIHRVSSGPSAAPSSSQAPGRPMYASTNVEKRSDRYGRKSKKMPSSSRNNASLDDDSIGKRPPRQLRVIKCPLVDKSGNPFDKEELSSIGSVLGSSKISTMNRSQSRLSTRVLQCLGVDADPAHSNRRSLAQQPEEDSGVRVSSDEGLPVEPSQDPSPTFCGLLSSGLTPDKEASGPRQATLTTSTSVDPSKQASCFPSFWGFSEDVPKESLSRSTHDVDVVDMADAAVQSTIQQDQSSRAMELVEESFSDDCRDDTSRSMAREERHETSVEVEMDRRDNACVRRDDDESQVPDQAPAPESDVKPYAGRKNDYPREPRNSSSRQSDRFPEPKTSPRGSFSWFRRSKKQVSASSSPVIYLNAPRQVTNETPPPGAFHVDQIEPRCAPVSQRSDVDLKTGDAHDSVSSENGDKCNEVDLRSPSVSPSVSAIVLQESPNGDEAETHSLNEKSRGRHSFRRTPSLISVKSLRTLVSTTSGCAASTEELNRRQELDSPLRAAASKEDSCAERQIRSDDTRDVQQNATSKQDSKEQQGADSSQSYLLGYLLAQLAFQRESQKSGDIGSTETKECQDLDPEEGMTLSEIMHQLQNHHSPRLSKEYLTYILAEFARHACTVDRSALQQGYVQRLSKRPAALQTGASTVNGSPQAIADQVATTSQNKTAAPADEEMPVPSFSQESSTCQVSGAVTASRSCASDIVSEVGEPQASLAGDKSSAARWTCFPLGSCFGPVVHANSMTDEDLDDIAAAVETTIEALRGDVADESSAGSSDGHSQNDTSEHDMGAWFDFLDGKEESYYSSGEFVDEEVDAEAVSVASDDIMHPSSTLSRCY